MLTTASADFSQFVVTTANETVCETSRDKPASLSSSTCLIYAHGLRLPFGLRCLWPAYPPCTPWYQVSIRQVTISLSLPPACTSRYKPWESLWGSSATTPLVDFHHRLTACPSYNRKKPDFDIRLFHVALFSKHLRLFHSYFRLLYL